MKRKASALDPLRLALWGIPAMVGGYLIFEGNTRTSLSLLGHLVFFLGCALTGGALVVWLTQAQQPPKAGDEDEEYRV